ncbi:hypothetical protein [Aureimonas altamirensis]|uniref:hypothetical protein n=1 Tax=Aureimonas altamirensis TaxID=370622 RepID=UPI00255248FD|nr:hypothetical protein [Aureimonas altamirensis]
MHRLVCPTSIPDRLLACEEQLEGALTYLAESAAAAGWGVGEIDLALLNLALARLKAADVNLDVDDAIRRANAMVGDPS